MPHSDEKDVLSSFIRIMDGKNPFRVMPLWKKIIFNIIVMLSIMPVAMFLFIEPNFFKFMLVFICFFGGVQCAGFIRQNRANEQWPPYVKYLNRPMIEERLRQIESEEKGI